MKNIPIIECHEPLNNISDHGLMTSPFYYALSLTDHPQLYARKTVIEKLKQVQAAISPYKLKILDAWRPRVLQKQLYHHYQSKLEKAYPKWPQSKIIQHLNTYVAPPHDTGAIPPHTTGGAIDLTLVDENGCELDMGTEFDYFGPEAASLFYEADSTNYQFCLNRRRLRSAMCCHGFRYDKDEWWHFDYGSQLWAFYLNHDYAIYGEVIQV